MIPEDKLIELGFVKSHDEEDHEVIHIFYFTVAKQVKEFTITERQRLEFKSIKSLIKELVKCIKNTAYNIGRERIQTEFKTLLDL